VLLTTENFDDRVCGWVKVIERYTSEFLTSFPISHPLYPRPYLVPFMRCSLWQVQNRSILLPLLRLTPRWRGFRGTIAIKFCTEVKQWLRYQTAKKYCQSF